MGQIKSRILNLSLRKSIVCHIIIFAALAILMGNITAAICSRASQSINSKYYNKAKKYYLTTEDGQRLGEGTYIMENPLPYSSADEKILWILDIIPTIAYPLYSALCVIASAALFYRSKLKQPMKLLMDASANISRNKLDFSLDYPGKDEMGQLCRAFEVMRQALSENYSQMWRLMEERKRLNAALAHDLRTPLTVLKGYTEMIQLTGGASEKETADIMSRHIQRMEQYLESMSNIRRLEDISPVYVSVSPEPWLASLKNTAAILCQKHNKELSFEQYVHSASMLLDINLIQQTFDNLLTNAVRYAQNSVHICIKENGTDLILSVADDGCGFSSKGLKQATEPYYREIDSHIKDPHADSHLGLGLYICKILCQHHGGHLTIENTSSGGKVTAFFSQKS